MFWLSQRLLIRGVTQNFFGRLLICYQELILEERQTTIAENRSNTLIYSSESYSSVTKHNIKHQVTLKR